MTVSENIARAVSEEIKRNPNAWVCVARAIALALIILFITPRNFMYITNNMGQKDLIIVWADDTAVITETVSIIRKLVPSLSYMDPPPPPRPSEDIEPTFLPRPGPQP